ncbi:hypothetical protein FACS189444_1450 [Spirochaetia bacterium]|nr:hypothetical protein FACS189444_1450 [Spirochaetia bacterium]
MINRKVTRAIDRFKESIRKARKYLREDETEKADEELETGLDVIEAIQDEELPPEAEKVIGDLLDDAQEVAEIIEDADPPEGGTGDEPGEGDTKLEEKTKDKGLRRIKERLLPKVKRAFREAKKHLREDDLDLADEAFQDGLDTIDAIESAEVTEDVQPEVEALVSDLLDDAQELAAEIGVTINEPTPEEVEEIILPENADPALEAIIESLSKTDRKAFVKLVEATKAIKIASHLLEEEGVEAAQPAAEEAAEAVVGAEAVEGVSEEVKANIEGVKQALDGLLASAGLEIDTSMEANPEAAIPPAEGAAPAPVQESLSTIKKRIEERRKARKDTQLKEATGEAIGCIADAILTAAGVPDGNNLDAPDKSNAVSQLPDVSLSTATKSPSGRVTWPNRDTKGTNSDTPGNSEFKRKVAPIKESGDEKESPLKRLQEQEEAAIDRYLGVNTFKFRELKAKGVV